MLLAVVVVSITASMAAVSPVGAVAARRASANAQRFCVPTAVIVDDVQKPVLQITPARASVLALTLNRTAKSATKSIGRSMRVMASMYSALGKSASAADRSKVAFAHATKFSKALKAVVAYYSTHCVAPPVQSPNFPVVSGANQAACLADAQALQIAETEYSTLNGGFGTMDQLLGAGLLSARSTMHPAITIGTPPGGYTLVGNQVCNNLPVAG